MPKLKVTIKSLDDVAEELRPLYSQQGDEYVLDVDDTDWKKKINEFRSNNIDLSKQLENATAQAEKLTKLQEDFKAYDGIDPEKAKEALKKMEAIKEQKLIEEGKFEDLFHQRTERMKRDHAAQVEALQKRLETADASGTALRTKLSDHLISDALQRAVGEVAVPRKNSMRDILSRGKETWKLDEEKNVPVPRNANGDIIYGKEANEPMSMKEWAEGLVADAPHLFEGNSGGGAGGSRRRVEGEREVSRDDPAAISANLKDIASGKVRVVS